MPAARFPKPPKLVQTQRTSLDASLHPKIDAFLKSARQCNQHVTPFESCLQDEMRVLERLYYKGVNQHRSALFWRRVKEVRRLGRRVLEVRLLGVLDDLRYSFYSVGEDAKEKSPKVLRGAWSHVPDAEFLLFTFERLRDILELIRTSKERLLKAYHSLSLMMQTGAFLQLIVLLTAIVSRMNAIMDELEAACQSFLDSFGVFLEALGHKSRGIRIRSGSVKGEPDSTLQSQHPVDRVDNEEVDIGEDLGSAVLRKTNRLPSNSNNNTHEESPGPLWRKPQESQDDRITTQDQESLLILETPSLVIETGTVGASSLESLKRPGPGLTSSTSLRETAKVKKKKKKRKDEIDDIFGSL